MPQDLGKGEKGNMIFNDLGQGILNLHFLILFLHIHDNC